ncbi:MAG: formate--tetrahydrofolate ligase [Candidatus Izemoplasmatales bacterium]|nr:formate--tetrahydrofolate ligase [Candidatus Izemoplasmatales bacterium]
MKSDLEIAQSATMKKITSIASQIGLLEDDIELYGHYKAKVGFSAIQSNRFQSKGKIILVTAINPTPAGEGKTTTTVGLGDSLKRLGYKTMIALREPSLGPVMGVKGGAAGGGYSQVVPMEDINLHFTGDIHAITAANNLISAVIDNHLYHGNELKIDSTRIIWKRAMDMNDRALRKIEVGLSSKKEVERLDAFDITVASEVMAVLCLSSDLDDLKQRISNMVIAYNTDGFVVTCADLKIQGAVTMLLKDAIKPNLVQTLENTPVLIHGGPFANIAHGCNSIIATSFAQRVSEYVVTEAGFGADLGMEKFMDIKMRQLQTMPSCVVIVVSIRALKIHGGVSKDLMNQENVEALKKGVANLQKHIESVSLFHVPYVLAINKFSTDSQAEVDWLMQWTRDFQIPAQLSEVFGKGSEGGVELAKEVVRLASLPKHPLAGPLYDLSLSINDKIKTIATNIYGADDVVFSEKALTQIQDYIKLGWDKLPICMAKTPLSLTDNPKIVGRPKGFVITVREFKPSIGAGFLVALTGDVMTMPGLPKLGAYENMDVVDNVIVGLF